MHPRWRAPDAPSGRAARFSGRGGPVQGSGQRRRRRRPGSIGGAMCRRGALRTPRRRRRRREEERLLLWGRRRGSVRDLREALKLPLGSPWRGREEGREQRKLAAPAACERAASPERGLWRKLLLVAGEAALTSSPGLGPEPQLSFKEIGASLRLRGSDARGKDRGPSLEVMLLDSERGDGKKRAGNRKQTGERTASLLHPFHSPLPSVRPSLPSSLALVCPVKLSFFFF